MINHFQKIRKALRNKLSKQIKKIKECLKKPFYSDKSGDLPESSTIDDSISQQNAERDGDKKNELKEAEHATAPETISDSFQNESQEQVRTQTIVTNEWGLFLGASLRGKSHIESGVGCQDYHLYTDLGEGWHLLIVSDGAGSAKYAERGSKGNCNVASQLFKEMIASNQWSKEQVLPSELQWYIECRAIFEKMKLIYRSKAKEDSNDIEETDFNATIIVCLITPHGLLAAHIGDGRMGYLSHNDEWRSLMIPHKGEEANQTLFLQNSWTYPQVPAMKISGVTVPETRIVNEIPKAVALISDGCEHSAWQCSIYNDQLGRYEDLNVPHPAFMNPLVDAVKREEPDNRMQLFIDILEKGTPSCERERDDKTMLIAINKELV